MRKANLIFLIVLVLAGGVFAGWHEPFSLGDIERAWLFEYAEGEHWIITNNRVGTLDSTMIKVYELSEDGPCVKDSLIIGYNLFFSRASYKTASIGDSMFFVFWYPAHTQLVVYDGSSWIRCDTFPKPNPLEGWGVAEHILDSKGRIWLMTNYEWWWMQAVIFDSTLSLIDSNFVFSKDDSSVYFCNTSISGDTISTVVFFQKAIFMGPEEPPDTLFQTKYYMTYDSVFNIREEPSSNIIRNFYDMLTTVITYWGDTSYAYSSWRTESSTMITKTLFEYNSPSCNWVDSIIYDPPDR